MGYRIYYGENTKKEIFTETRRNSKVKTNLIWISIACFALIFAAVNNIREFADYLLPGNKEITRTAIATFADDLRNGESFSAAATAFCREIIDNANASE